MTKQYEPPELISDAFADAVTHNPMNSPDVRKAHGGVWNWMALMLAAFVFLVAYHSLGE